MPSQARPSAAAFKELQFVVRNLVDELAGFRRRALAAEARLRELEPAPGEQSTGEHASNGASGAGASASVSAARLAELEQENAMLRARLESAADRARRMLDRMRFLRQQHAAAGER